jgi:hypothetical protein
MTREAKRVAEFRKRNADKIDRLQLYLPAGTKAKLEELAKDQGFKTITELLVNLDKLL